MKVFSEIGVFPKFDLGMVMRPAGPFAVEIESFTSLHTSGRAALYWAFRGMKFPPGSIVWMPSFHCGVEIQAALDANLGVKFYRVREDLSFDTEEIVTAAKGSPVAILVIHYFGFPQPQIENLAAECRERGWVLVEDCAHALFSRNYAGSLGQFGPVAIYSLRKTLPLFHGGALKVDQEQLRSVLPSVFEMPRLRMTAARSYLDLVRSALVRRVGNELLSWNHSDLLGTDDTPGTRRSPSLKLSRERDEPMSALCRVIASSADAANVVRARRDNYEQLERLLQPYAGYSALFPKLPLGTCPLCLPIRVKNRAAFLLESRNNSISPFIFGAYSHAELPAKDREDSRWIRNTIIGLPVHQYLESADLSRMAERLGPLLWRC